MPSVSRVDCLENDVDHTEKVKLRPEDNEAKVYREVNNLSRVSHQYIVRYHACWIEDQTPQPPTPSESDVSTPTPNASISDEPSDPFAINFDDMSRRDQSRSASFPRIRFANGDDSDEEDDSDSDADSDATSSDETAADPSELRGRGAFVRQSMPIQPRISESAATGTTADEGAVQSILYIQMEFVEKVSDAPRRLIINVC
jgi:translation initiation factor 2-alpha kinase 4